MRTEFGILAYVQIRFKVIRSTLAPPNKESFGFIFNQRGFDRGFELLRGLLSIGHLEKAGAYFKDPDGETIGPGYDEASNQVTNNFDHYRRIYENHSGNK